MTKLLSAGLLLLSCSCFSQNTPYEKAWKLLGENKRSEAAVQFAEAEKNPQTFSDAYISKLYLASYNGKESMIDDFDKAFYKTTSNPYPYIYALWFNSAVIGGYGKKTHERQVKLIDRIIADDKAPGTLVASANYQRGCHNLYSNEFEKADHFYNGVGNLKNWQFAGPFENISQSGFFKSYGPLENPQPTAVFKSLTNADVKWITPSAECNEGWTPVCYQYNTGTAVVYAQNFVNSPADQTVLCNVGATGSVKVWINDELIVAEPGERVTEMDVYSVKYDLKKGVNRVLVQLGFTQSTFPNFCVRFTNEQYRPISSLTGSPVYAPYPKASAGAKKYTLLPQFAEVFFKDKVTREPDNMVNYLLLADVYLRNQKLAEARSLLDVAMKKMPDNCLLRMKMIDVLVKEDNRTLLLEEIEKVRENDPDGLVVMDMNIKEYYNDQKYEDCAAELEKRIRLHGEDLSTHSYKILLLGNEKKYEELVQEAEKLFVKFPDNTQYLEAMYEIKKGVYQDHEAAMKVYEDFMKNNFNYGVYEKYAGLLAEQGNNERSLEIRKKLAELFPYSPEGFRSLAKYYYASKQYDKAEEYINQALKLCPYNETYLEDLGDIKSEKKNVEEALEAFNQSLKHDPNQYTILNKVRKLAGKPELVKYFPEADIAKLIREDNPADAKNADYGYYYILDQKDVIIYPGGATESYYTSVIRITNEKGVDRYKESSIDYSGSESLLIEKAEVIKKNRSKIEGERNQNVVVFTNLEAGDVVVFKYRLQSYVYGRFGKEFWDKYYFNGQIYSAAVKYTILAPADLKINYTFNNSTIKPVVTDVENFKQYYWEMLKAAPEKDEPLMPALADVAPILHISTIPAWKDIADWYSDVSYNKSEEDFEIVSLLAKLFPAGQKNMSQFQKAKIIYEYIQANIRYSSVSFRQSAYVPQRASATLSTRLGDCKDLSSLFVTLAHMSGINAQMVLVDTRGSGEKQMLLPSMEFNHCIVKAVLDNKSYFIEMTDSYLPFGSLPNVVLGAVMLEIPSKNIPDKPELKILSTPNRTRDVVKRYVDINPLDADINMSVRTVMTGALSSDIRSEYLNLEEEKQLQTMEKIVAGKYKNNVKLAKINFKGLDKLNDSVEYNYSFKVKNEISEIGSLKTFRIVYPDVVASLDHFSADTRTYPIEYFNYENADGYETVVNITAPAGSKFVELPSSETLNFKDMHFSIQYTLKAPDKLVVTRKFTNGRKSIPAADYADFKSFFEKIVRAEQKFVAYR